MCFIIDRIWSKDSCVEGKQEGDKGEEVKMSRFSLGGVIVGDWSSVGVGIGITP